MHEKMSAVLEHSTEAFGEAVSCANRGSVEYRAKLMEIARANANTAFDLARAVFDRMVEALGRGELGEGGRAVESIRVTLHESHVASASFEARVSGGP